MAAKRNTDVLVAGGGPVGLFSALALARNGIRVEILEEQWRPASRSYALALHSESLRLLSSLDLAPALLANGNSIEQMGLYGEGSRQGEISFSGLPGKYPLVLVLPQHQLEEVLHAALEEEGVEIRWNHRLAGFEQGADGVTAQVEQLTKESSGYSVSRTEWVVAREETVEAQFLIGADGHRSLVRRHLGIDFPTCGKSSTFAVFEFSAVAREGAGEELQIVLDDKTTNVLWPLSEGRFRWSFELPDFAEDLDPRFKSRLFVQVRDEAFPHVSEEKLADLIAERAPWFDAKIIEVIWSAAIRFEQRLAGQFGRGRAMLVGDAAHLAIPIGIQSMNVGFREAMDLAKRIAHIVRGRTGRESLDEYAEQWKQEWERLLSIRESVSVQGGASPWIQQRAPRIPLCIPASGNDLNTLLAQIGIRPQ